MKLKRCLNSYQANRWGNIPGDLNYKYTKSVQFYQLVNKMAEESNSNKTGKKFRLKDPQPSSLDFARTDSQDFSVARKYEDILYLPNVI